MAKIFTVDPGPTYSGWYYGDPFDKQHPVIYCGKTENRELLHLVRVGTFSEAAEVGVEEIISYGRAVGAETFITCRIIGRLEEICERIYGSAPILIPRRVTAKWVCDHPNAKDEDVRRALVDKYGPGKDKAIGLKRCPGPLYKVTADVWLALGMAVALAEDPQFNATANKGAK